MNAWVDHVELMRVCPMTILGTNHGDDSATSCDIITVIVLIR